MLGMFCLFLHMKCGVFFFKYLTNLENRGVLTDRNIKGDFLGTLLQASSITRGTQMRVDSVTLTTFLVP